MKLIHALLAAAMAAMLAMALGVVADEDVVIKKEIKIITDGDAEAIDLDIADLEVGETRQMFTESGKEVVITRTEEGYEIDVDGEEIEIGGHGHLMMVHGHGHDDHDANIIVKHFEAGDEKGFHFVTGDGEMVEIDLEQRVEWVHEGGADGTQVRVMSLGGHAEGLAKKLEKSGVLDDLDDAKRQEILDALKTMGPHVEHIGENMMVIEIDDEEDGGEE